MITKQKIKKIIIILVFMIISTISLIFHSNINYFFKNLMADKCGIISNKDTLIVHFINVGQADATAINFPDGKIMLIDTGSDASNYDYINYLNENVVNTRNNKYIDYLVLSHADMDHVGGTIKLLKNFKIGTIFLPKISSDSQGYTEILNNIQNNCKSITMGQEIEIKTDVYAITFFEILSDDNTNDSSQMIKVECNKSSFLFTGDISSNIDKEYVEKYGEQFDVDVLKVSHHGSNSASSEEFLKVVTPKYAVISVGKWNDYGHPNYEVLGRIKENGAQILRTDRDDDIVFAVGNVYGLKPIYGGFYITSLSLNYANIVAVIDGALLICCVFIILNKNKKEKNT